MRASITTSGLFLASMLAIGPAFADDPKDDQPTTVNGVDMVCTGTTLDVRADPRWRDYSLRLEFVGQNGQYLGDEQVKVTGAGQDIDVHCQGPWVLMKLPKGDYKISTDVADAGHKEMTARVPASGQAHIVVRFPQAGGEVAHGGAGRQAAR